MAAVLAAVVLGLGVWRIIRIAQDLRAAERAFDRAEIAVQKGDLKAAQDELVTAEVAVASANGSLQTSPELDLLRLVPVIRQNLRSLDDSVQVAFRLANGGRSILRAGQPFTDAQGKIEIPLRAGSITLAPIPPVVAAMKELAYDLPDEERPSERLLLSPVRSLQRDVYDEASRRRRQFVSVARGMDLLTELAGLNGPRRYLIAVANAAEMRGTGGMILSYGELVSGGGKFSLERFGPIDDLKVLDDPPGDPLPYPRRLAPYAPLKTWRNTNLAPDFDVVGPVQERLYTAATGKPVSGVLQIDSAGLAALLKVTGPLDVPGVAVVTADNVVPLTLNENYLLFPNRRARQDVQSQVAQAVFERLVSGDFPSVRNLAAALADAAAGRHVMLHSTNAGAQRRIRLLGADGSLPGPGTDFAQLSVQNFSGNKVDYYVDTGLKISGRRPAGAVSTVRVQVEVANTAPAERRERAVFGPFDASLAPGEYRGLVSLYLPLGAHVTRNEGNLTTSSVVIQSEFNRSVLTYGVDLPAGARHVMTIDVQLPAPPGYDYQFRLVPTPRVRPTVVTLGLERGGGSAVRLSGPLGQTVTVRPRNAGN